METAWQAMWYFIPTVIIALMEIEIEGPDGWAGNLPTWRLTKNSLLLILTGKRPVTGYWFFSNLLFLTFFHHPLLSASWDLKQEADILFRWFIFLPTWDFLWFVLNPYYGLKNFRKENVWWHGETTWIFKLFPQDYFWSIVIGLALPLAVIILKNGWLKLLTQSHPYLYYLAVTFSLVLLIVLSAPFYHRIYNRLNYLRKNKKTDL